MAVGCSPIRGEEFAGEVYQLGASVSDNGSARAFPGGFAPTRFLDFPGVGCGDRCQAAEAGALPTFGDLSRIMAGAVALSLDSANQFNVFAATVATPGIEERPGLPGTREQRMDDPSLRPGDCPSCASYRDMVYRGDFNYIRTVRAFLPRGGVAERPIPVEIGAGSTAKFFYEELEGGDYLAQNLNLDLGASAKVLWGYDPARRESDRDLLFFCDGFELLGSDQVGAFAGAQVRERVPRRWHYGLAWTEGFAALDSRFSLGISHASESGSFPALGLEWSFRDLLRLRAGLDQQFLSAGASLAYGPLALHYAFVRHDLETSLYQVSLQYQWSH